MRSALSGLLLVLLVPAFAQGEDQEAAGGPFPVLPGRSFAVTEGLGDTVWLFDHAAYKVAVKKALKHQYSDSLLTLLEKKSVQLDSLIIEQDNLNRLNREGYIHYRDLWGKTDRELEKAEIELARIQEKTWLTGVIGVIGILLLIAQ